MNHLNKDNMIFFVPFINLNIASTVLSPKVDDVDKNIVTFMVSKEPKEQPFLAKCFYSPSGTISSSSASSKDNVTTWQEDIIFEEDFVIKLQVQKSYSIKAKILTSPRVPKIWID